MAGAPHLVATEDGSLTCRDEVTGELYHNRAGAYSEALKNYAEPAHMERMVMSHSTLRILDVCYGLGYNSLVTLSRLMESGMPLSRIEVRGIEIDPEILKAIPRVLEDHRLQPLAKELSTWSGLHVDIGDLREIVPSLESASVDVIFHDPFSPQKVPQFWTMDLFRHYARILRPGGKILTYSSASAVRSALERVGLRAYRTTALGAKSGGTLASFAAKLQCSHVFDIDEAERAKMRGPAGIPYRDPNFRSTREEVFQRRKDEQG